MDDEVYAEEPMQRGVEVVPFSVYRNEVNVAAQDAATAAVDGSLSRVESVGADLAATVSDVADAAADGAVTRLLAASDPDGTDTDESESVPLVVVLDDSQWGYVQSSLRLSCTFALFSLLMVSMLCGLVACRYLVRGWRGSV